MKDENLQIMTAQSSVIHETVLKIMTNLSLPISFKWVNKNI